MLRRKVPKSAGTSGYCGAPTRLIVPPARTTRERGLDRRPQADALQHGVGAVAAGQLPDLRDALLAALGDDVGGAELATQVGAGLVPAHQDDLLGAEPLGRQHRAQPDRAVADHGHRRPRVHPGGHGAVVPGREHVGQRQQRRQQRRVLPDRQLHQRALRLRHPHRLTLPAVHAGRTPAAAVPARGLQALPAEVAGVVRPHERRHHDVAGLEPGHLGADVLDHAEELVPDPPALLGGRHRPVRPQVAAADARPQHPHHRIGRLA